MFSLSLQDVLCCLWVLCRLLFSGCRCPILTLFLNLQNDQKDYFVCGVKLPNSEDFQGSWIFNSLLTAASALNKIK